MRGIKDRKLVTAVPVAASLALVLAACGSGGSSSTAVAQQPAVPAPAAAAAPAAASASVATNTADSAPAPAAGAVAAKPAAVVKTAAVAAPAALKAHAQAQSAAAPAAEKAAAKPAEAHGSATGGTVAGENGNTLHALDTGGAVAANQKIADSKGGATDVGVTKDGIHMGTVSMHGMALGNVLIEPIVRGIRAEFESENDRGGILGRRLSLTDCDDGPGEVSRTKACIKKLATVDKVFGLLNITSWGAASSHDDLAQYHMPSIGQWAYSQTEWQDPFMFPTHMSMIHEAMAGAHWAVNVIKPKTYGLICLTSPEMQLACNEVQRVMDASGAKMVKRADVSISETSMSAYVLAFRAANPEHIIHYVINPATMAKFIVEAAQQGYYPPKGISGNHLAAEVLGQIFGQWPVGRYWTNTTYKLWGPEFTATMNKYARGNTGVNHHIVQSTYVGAQIMAQAARAVGPNLTRDRLIAELGNGDVYRSEAAMDQRFSYTPAERGGNWSHDMGQGREFMYKYTSENTTSNPDGSPNGFAPDSSQFVIYTWK
jgi:hypothetical protein